MTVSRATSQSSPDNPVRAAMRAEVSQASPAAIALPIGHLSAGDLGRVIRVSVSGGVLEGVLTSTAHALRRDGMPETTLLVQQQSGSIMSASWSSSTPCQLMVTDTTAADPLPDLPITPGETARRLRGLVAGELLVRRQYF
jgi:hypothetical protein